MSTTFLILEGFKTVVRQEKHLVGWIFALILGQSQTFHNLNHHHLHAVLQQSTTPKEFSETRDIGHLRKYSGPSFASGGSCTLDLHFFWPQWLSSSRSENPPKQLQVTKHSCNTILTPSVYVMHMCNDQKALANC